MGLHGICDCCGHKPCVVKAKAALQAKYDKLVHAVWHALDDSEQRVRENEIVISKQDYNRLSKLVPEDHP